MVDGGSGRLAVAVPEVGSPPPAPPGAPPPASHRPASRPWRVRNWRMRWRVLALVLIPTVAAVVFGGFRIQDARATSATAGRTGQLGTLGAHLTTLTESLEDERDLTAGYVGARLSHNAAQEKSLLGMVQAQEATTDQWTAVVQAGIGQIGGAFPAVATADLATIQASLGGGAINELRTLAGTLPGTQVPSQMSALPLVIRYSNLIATLLEFHNDIAAGTSNAQLAQTVTSFTSLAQAQEDASQQRALVYAALEEGMFETGALPQTTSAQSSEQSVEATYQKVSANLPSYTAATGLTAAITQAQQFNNVVEGPQIDQAIQIENDAIQAGALGGSIAPAGAPEDWYNDMTFTLRQMRQVEQDELSSIAVQASATQTGAQNSATLTSVIVALVILVVLIVTVLMARSMIIPLRRLRADALDVAGRRLPAMVQRLSQEVSESIEIEPIGIDSTDEIGEVARAFDRVHGEAVRLASEEAMLRANLNAMFVNLSRRSQTLIERQLGIIESLEQTEQESSRLSSLFRLDHLATRMRRNSENLLVLAGHEAPRKWTQPVALVDVLRAAVSEIEQYERITLNVQSGLVIAGKAASDVVHLVAELVENATTFSRKDTQVFVTGQILVSGGVLIEITDEGLGIPEQELAYANWRLDNPPVIDVAVSRRMGLFVVGRLAARHGIKVRLRRAQSGGLSALIWVPETVAETESAAPLGSRRRFGTGGQPVLITSPAQVANGARTPVLGMRAAARPKSVWFDTGNEEAGLVQEPDRGSQVVVVDPPLSAPAPAPVAVAPAAPATVAVPAAEPPPAAAGEAPGGRLPIYDSIESEWFRRGSTTFGGGGAGGPAGATWTSPADEGFRRAAATIASPVAGQTTTAGLPKRVPSANLVPGSISARPAPRTEQAPPPADGPSRSPEAVRARLSGFQLRGREGRPDGSPGPGAQWPGTDEN